MVATNTDPDYNMYFDSRNPSIAYRVSVVPGSVTSGVAASTTNNTTAGTLLVSNGNGQLYSAGNNFGYSQATNQYTWQTDTEDPKTKRITAKIEFLTKKMEFILNRKWKVPQGKRGGTFNDGYRKAIEKMTREINSVLVALALLEDGS